MICKHLTKDGAYERLIETGIRLFGKYGYESVSIRQITKDAKVNIAAVCYHFGCKKKFYEHVVQHLTDEVLGFTTKFDMIKFEKLPLEESKIELGNLIRYYQKSFISEHGINRLNIFMHEAFLNSSSDASAIYTNSMKNIYSFFSKILSIYFGKKGKDQELVNFSIAIIHGIIQCYVITNKNIAPSEIKLTHNVLEQAIQVILE